MSDLKVIDKQRLENLFDMRSGYVLEFTNNRFQEFVIDSVQRDIYSGKYDHTSCSKANLLRKFWLMEPNHVVGKLLIDLIEIAKEESSQRANDELLDECKRIAERLLKGSPMEEFDTISEELTEKDFELLVKSIRSSIDANEPESGLDRLHTFVMKFLRRLCEKKKIDVNRKKPLHSLLGDYIKRMKSEGNIKTQMTERILKSSIANLESFNTVRNDYSFAHDNPVLNYNESLLIFNHVVSAIRFIQAFELQQDSENQHNLGSGDIPF